jgi:hypothetical protein
MISSFRRMSSRNMLYFKNRSEYKAKSNYSSYAASNCGFYLRLQQRLVVEF